MYQEWVGYNINQVFDYTCKVRGTGEALVSGDLRLTYNEWQRRIFQMAQGLRTVGIGKGSRVALIIDTSPEFAYLCLALYRLGAVIIPLNLTWVGRELAESLDLTDAEVLVTIESFRGRNYVAILEETFPELASANRDEVSIQRLPHLKTIVTLSREGNNFAFAHDYDAIMALGTDYSAEEMLALGHDVTPADECLCLPTSGSTGFPKPVVHTHESFLANCSSFLDGLEFRATDRFLNFGPTYHISGMVFTFMPSFRGGTVHQLSWFDPETALGIIEKERITTMWGFDVHYLMMRRHARFEAYDISSLERTMVGSDPGSYEEIKSMGLSHQGNIYGCSEYLSNFFPYRDRFDEHRMKSSHGRPMAHVQQKIADPITGETLGPEQLGEICVKGPGLFKGYYKMPEETAEAMDADGFFHAGDYGWMDEKGYTYYRGRLKDTVKTGGENVSAREVEMFLEAEVPWVATAQVFGVPDVKWGEAVTAMVELRPGAMVSEEELRSYCKGKLAGYKIPKRVLFVDRSDWIITPTGKFDKQALRRKTLESLGVVEGPPA